MSRSSQMHENLTDDVRQLMVLNAELETAVEVLKGEIWTLNEQLKGVNFLSSRIEGLGSFIIQNKS